jgi:hypothetical protein
LLAQATPIAGRHATAGVLEEGLHGLRAPATTSTEPCRNLGRLATAMIGVVALVGACSSFTPGPSPSVAPSPSATFGAPVSASPTESFASIPTAPTSALSWRSYRVTGLPVSAEIAALVVAAGSNDVLVAFTNHRVPSSEGLPHVADVTAWRSTDGMTWTKEATLRPPAISVGVPIDELDLGPAAYHNGTFIIGGRTASVNGAEAAVVWTSEDGATWTLREPPRREASQINAIAASESGVVAVGLDGAMPGSWTSPDGVHWLSFDGFGAATTDLIPWRLTASSSGSGYLATGDVESDPACSGNPQATIWSSIDGGTWTRLPADGLTCASNGRLTVGSAGYLLVAYSQTETGSLPGAWTSADGRSWVGPTKLPFADQPGDGVSALGTLDGRYVALAPHGGIWESSDGHDWIRSSDPGAIQPMALADHFALGCNGHECRLWIVGPA